MSRFLFSLLAVCFMASCDTGGDETPAALEGSAAKDLEGSAAKVAGSDLDAAVKSAGEGSAAISEGSAAMNEAASGLTANLSAALDSSFDTAKLKDAVGSLPVDKLKDLGTQFLNAIKTQDGALASLKEKLGGVGALAGGDALKGKIEAGTKLLGELKEKLNVVVAKLQEHGVDVSQFSGYLK